jgi:serine protease AprX
MLNVKNIQLIAIFLFALSFFTEAQQQQWMVYFKDKQRNGFNPYEYFDARTIERRILAGLSVDDPADWPVNSTWVDEITPMVQDVIFTSRWFNAVAVEASPLQMARVMALPFVLDAEYVEPSSLLVSGYNEYDTTMDFDEEIVLKGQLSTLGVDAWQKAGITGKGIRIAIFDVGFDHADKVPAFDHIRNEKRLIATRDFTKRGNSENVYYGNGHGTQVWSCIAGRIGDLQIGLATGAEFLLAKTEKNSEKFSEELNWLAAAEWADKNGADIINSSLGYTYKRYFNWQMDGRTSFISRAANMAARKGMLVVNAAGNEGSGKWHYVGAPADADSVLSVGGINPATGYHTSFSSYGPTSDKRMKPNVSAYGHVTAAAPAGLTSTQGTSFSSPLVAGFAACAWQTNRSLTNMQLFQEIEKSGSLYPYFDYAHGYGVPQANYFTVANRVTVAPTFELIETNDTLRILAKSELSGSVLPELSPDAETFIPEMTDQGINYFYYNIMDAAGVIESYYVLNVTLPEVLTIIKSDYPGGKILNIHYAGYSLSVKL